MLVPPPSLFREFDRKDAEEFEQDIDGDLVLGLGSDMLDGTALLLPLRK